MIFPTFMPSFAKKLGKLIMKIILQIFAWPIYGCFNYVYGIYNVFKYVCQNVSDSAIAILDFARNFRKNVLTSILTLILIVIFVIVAAFVGKAFKFMYEKVHPTAFPKQGTKKYNWPAYIICIGTILVPAQKSLSFLVFGLQVSSYQFVVLLDPFSTWIAPLPLPARFCLWLLYLLGYFGVTAIVTYVSYRKGFKKIFLATSRDKFVDDAFDSIFFAKTRTRFIALILVLQIFGWILFDHSGRQKVR